MSIKKFQLEVLSWYMMKIDSVKWLVYYSLLKITQVRDYKCYRHRLRGLAWIPDFREI